LLEVDYRRLIYHLYQVPENSKYEIFLIPKRSGGTREISAPITALKIIQTKLNEVLSNVYKPKQPVFGYVQERNIVDNARKHRRARYVFNLDLKDFFPTINFGRVRGLFIAKPYSLPPPVATVIAQICIHKNYLPQGVPTSPIISNMICARMDRQLQLLAKNNKCYYTRYADDLVFSTSLKKFPEAIAKSLSLTEVQLGDALQIIIEGNGFRINERKIRLSPYFRRQEVAGLTVNDFPNVRRRYVREIRAMLHTWDKFGVLKAESDFFTKYDHTHRNPKLKLPTYRQVVKGKIEFLGMVRGKGNEIYSTF
jgi:RNA-directed DNA polymerase